MYCKRLIYLQLQTWFKIESTLYEKICTIPLKIYGFQKHAMERNSTNIFLCILGLDCIKIISTFPTVYLNRKQNWDCSPQKRKIFWQCSVLVCSAAPAGYWQFSGGGSRNNISLVEYRTVSDISHGHKLFLLPPQMHSKIGKNDIRRKGNYEEVRKRSER